MSDETLIDPGLSGYPGVSPFSYTWFSLVHTSLHSTLSIRPLNVFSTSLVWEEGQKPTPVATRTIDTITVGRTLDLSYLDS